MSHAFGFFFFFAVGVQQGASLHIEVLNKQHYLKFEVILLLSISVSH